MDLSTADSSVEGLFEGNAPPSPSPAPRQAYPTSPKDITMSSNLGFRPPPRPGSSTRKGRKSDFTTTSAPPPLPSQSLSNEYRALVDSTNLARNGSPTRSSSATSLRRQLSDQGKTVDVTRVARERLQLLRQENEAQVNSAGMLGQGLLGLRTKIEALMDELAEELSAADEQSEDASSAKEHTARIRILAERIEAEIEDLEQQKRSLFSDITTHNIDATKGDDAVTLESAETPSKATRVANAIRNLTSTPGKSPAQAPAPVSTTPRPEDRRSRNAAARQAKADTDLINEIQAGLVQEVRRLQGLLKERDDQRVAIERSHAEIEKQLDQYKPKVIQMTEAEDALKQENWDLSVAKQNLDEQLNHINSALKKAELDNLRLNKDVAKAREVADSQRLQIDSQAAEIDRMNKSRETEIALARRERAGMQRNVSDLQGELQRFRTQQLNDRGSVSRSVSNSFMSDMAHDDMGEDADAITARLRAAAGESDSPRSLNDSVYSTNGAVLSPIGNRLGRDKEAQDLRAKLAMAQRKAGKDAAEKRRVREKNSELKKLLVQSGVKIPQGLDDDAETSEDEELHWMDEADTNSPSAKRLSHIRSARPPAHRPRLGKLMGMVSSDSADSIVEYAEYEDEAEASTMQDDSPSRGSLDGMDPAFADMMQPDPADTSIDSASARLPVRRGHKSRASIGSSPLARASQLPFTDEDDSPLQRGTIKAGRRSGANAVRSISTVFQPSALGNELDELALETEIPDLVTPALAERDLQHAEAVRLIHADHAKFVEAVHSDHAAAVEAIHATHADTLESTHSEQTARIAELSNQHSVALENLKKTHQAQIDALNEEHAQAVSEGEEKHASQLASALTERNEIHEAAIGEARSRHSRALAEQVAASSAELAAALALHKTSSEDLDRKHREERKLTDASHTFALSQKERQHQEAVQSLTVAHADILDQTQKEHGHLLANKEQALVDSGAKLEQTRVEHAQLLADKEQALKDAASQLQQTRAEHTELLTTKEQALQESVAKLEESRVEHTQLLASKEKALQTALAKYEQTCTEHAQLLGAKEKTLSDAAAHLEQIQTDHGQTLAKKEQALQSHAAQLEQSRTEHTQLQASKAQALQEADALLEQTRTEHAQVLADKERALNDAGSQLDQQQKARSELETAHASALVSLRDTHSQELAARDQQVADCKIEIEKLQQTVKSLTDELDRLRRQISELEQTHSSTQRELDETKSNLGMVSDKARRQEEAASELARQKEAEAVAAAAAVAARSEALTATEAEKEQLEAAHVLAIAQKERQHNDALKALDGSHQDTVSQIRTEHKQTLASRDLDVQTHKDESDKLRLFVQTHKDESEKLRVSNQTYKDEANKLHSTIEMHKEEAGKLRSTIQSHENEAEKLRSSVETHRQESEELRGTVEMHLQEMATLRGAVQTHQSESDKLQGTIKTHEEEAAGLREGLQSHKDESDKLRETVRTHEKDSDALRILVQTHKDESDALRNAVQTHQNELAELHNLVQKHKDESDVLRNSTQAHKDESDKLRGTIQSHVGEAETLRTTVQSLEVQLARLNQESAAMQQSKAAMDKQMQGSKSEYASLQKQHDDSKTLIASLQSKVRYLESAIAAEKSSTEQNRLSSDKELQTFQSALNTAQKKVREQESALSRTEIALAAALAATAAAEAQVQSKNEMVTDTETEAYEDAEENIGTHQSRNKAELKENSCQTDEQAWTLFKQTHSQNSSEQVPGAIDPDSLIGQGGVIMVGGARSANRPRDSVSTFGGVRDDSLRAESPAPTMYTPEAVTGLLGRRKSTDSTRSRSTNQAGNETVPPVPAMPDKSKPPVMAMPGPPKMPPPTSVVMARGPSAGSSAPQRPLSPPPADLLARAQQRHLQIPAKGEQSRSASRASGRTGPPPSAFSTSNRIRQPSSGAASVRSRTTSGETASSTAQHTPLDASTYSTLLSGQKSISSRKSTPGPKTRRPAPGPRASSAASFASDVTSEVSRRLSMMSSQASEADEGDNTFIARGPAAGPGTGLAQFGAESTDPAIIHAITQTMIGEYMYKYTRKSMGRVGHSDKRHKRYFWVHPYTRMLYWTLSDPGGAKVSEGTSKSASIEHVRVVNDFNPSPPWLHHESLIITTATREVKITAPSRDRHEVWLAALQYLMHRPTIQDATVVAGNVTAAGGLGDTENDASMLGRGSVQKRRSRTSASTISTSSRYLSPQHSLRMRGPTDHPVRSESTPQRRSTGHSVLYPSMGKRSNLAAKEWLQQHEDGREITMSPTHSVRGNMYSSSVNEPDLGDESYDMMDLTATRLPNRNGNNDARLKTAEEMLEEDEPEGFDGLTNVRACCDGRHDVGSLAHTHAHAQRRDGNGYSSDKGSRKSSRLHRRRSSGASRFSSIGLKSKLDAAVRSAEEREQQPVPRLPHSILATMDGKLMPRESMDSGVSTSKGKRPRVSDATFANLFAPIDSNTNSTTPLTTTGGTVGSKAAGVGPSYGERIQKIKLRQSLDGPQKSE